MTTYWRITYADGTHVTVPVRGSITHSAAENIAETVQGEGYGAIESIEEIDSADLITE